MSAAATEQIEPQRVLHKIILRMASAMAVRHYPHRCWDDLPTAVQDTFRDIALAGYDELLLIDRERYGKR